METTTPQPPPRYEEEAFEPTVDVDALAPQGRPCDSCGFPVEPGERFCPACGTQQPAPEVEVSEKPPRHLIRCETCGAEVATEQTQRSYTCPFCDSNYVVEFAETAGRHRPEFVIGFAVTPQQALQKFRTWIRQNAWFRPGDLSQAKIEEKLRGVYLPFWSFSMLAESQWQAMIGEYWYRTETYTVRGSDGKTQTRTRRVRETEWWRLEGEHHHYYSGYLVSGSRGLSQRDADRIKPFQLPALKRYDPMFLAGWNSEVYSVEEAEALETCQRHFYRREQDAVAAFLPGDEHRSLSVRTEFDHVNSDLCLLPVYLLSYRYQDKLYRFLLNGQTGKTAGDKPLSWKRIAIAAGVGLAVLVLIIVLFMIFGR